ncbi:MAG: hypothetical protein ABIJ31_14610 [Pseudomonadota bacterium]
MGTRKQDFNGQSFEILDHAQVPGFKTAFHIIICAAAVYFIYIFVHAML